MAEMAYYILNVFGWNDKLGYLDNGKYSWNRSHNDQERIGKKFQWLAYYRVYARLMDSCRTSKEQYYYKDEPNEGDLVESPYPWNTSEVSRFDPTLDVEYKINLKACHLAIKKQLIHKMDDDIWIDKNEYLPSFRNLASNKDGNEYVMLIGYDTAQQDKKETFLFNSACFVRSKDKDKFAEWAKEQNFYGRWMPERSGMTEFLWNDYPWADAYNSSFEHEPWLSPEDCPCEIMLSYEAQLQEDWEGIDREDEYFSTAYAPCEEIMKQMKLYCSEMRGIVKSEGDDSFAALNTGHGDGIKGLFIRRDILNKFLSKNGYVMFYYVLGEKLLKLGGINSKIRDLSAAYLYDEVGKLVEIQKMRVVDRKNPEEYNNAQQEISDESMIIPIDEKLKLEE